MSSEPSPSGAAAIESDIGAGLETYALVRTAFSSERSLLSWMRTYVSLYSLGFSIMKFMSYLDQQHEEVALSEYAGQLGLVLVIVVMLALTAGIVEHVQRLRRMTELGLPANSRSFLPFAAAIALLGVGIAALIFGI